MRNKSLSAVLFPDVHGHVSHFQDTKGCPLIALEQQPGTKQLIRTMMFSSTAAGAAQIVMSRLSNFDFVL